MSEASSKALQAAIERVQVYGSDTQHDRFVAEDVIRAAHSTELGLDRSVCLRDVVNALDSPEAGLALGSFKIGRAASNYVADKFS